MSALVALAAGCSKPTELASESNAVASAPEPAAASDPAPEINAPDAIAPDDPPSISDEAQERFADYQPKTTPDTVLDYRPSLSAEIGALPPVSDPMALAQAFLDWKARAAASPGVMEDGAIPLGGDPQEYRPSDAELVAAEAGDRLSAALAGADEPTRAAVAVLLPDAASRAYRRFAYRHSDVMGSGRFFYSSPPKDAAVPG